MSQVIKGKPTITVTAIAIIKHQMDCSAFGKSLILPTYYRVKKKIETGDSFRALVNVSTSKWTGLWEPLIRETIKITIRNLPQLLKSIERIDLHELMDNLTMMGRNHLTKRNPTAQSLVISRNLVIIVLVNVLVGYGRLGLKICRVHNELVRDCQGEERRLMDLAASQE